MDRQAISLYSLEVAPHQKLNVFTGLREQPAVKPSDGSGPNHADLAKRAAMHGAIQLENSAAGIEKV
jgi:hypothetical protein